VIGWGGWAGFLAVVLGLLLLDLVFFHRRPHEITTRQAVACSAVWIGLGLGFSLILWPTLGGEAVQSYLAGYLIEESLSIDNLFVFVVIFAYFGIPARYQYRVLFFGVLGAFLFRGAFIALGAALLARFSWIAFLFGAFLLFTAYRLATARGDAVNPEDNRVLDLLRRYAPVTHDLHGQRFFARQDGGLAATPLLAVLFVIETTDILFAVDSIPAVFGVTRRAFIVFSSNAMALLGLRSLYFLVAHLVERFRFLDAGLSLVLGLIGAKLIYEELVHLHERGGVSWLPDALAVQIPTWAPLLLVAVVISSAALASVLWPVPRGEESSAMPHPGHARGTSSCAPRD
jgi:tellurite resistance protein TerC